MKEFLRRLKLIDSLTTTLATSRAEFISRLNEITDRGNTGLMSDTFDVFSSNKNEFKGQVNFDSFKIKRRRRFFDTNMNSAVAEGVLVEDSEGLVVNTEINGLNNFFILFLYITNYFILNFYSKLLG